MRDSGIEEPAIFFEYAYATAGLAKEEGLRNVFVTNGYMTSGALETIHPYCHEMVIRRGALSVEENRLQDSRCPSCGSFIPEVFEEAAPATVVQRRAGESIGLPPTLVRRYTGRKH